ncbi:hypothetical protein E0K83_14425 [Gramella sp. BOM4]|nr:hypothetical protein [Christiangramia bathymodioli]
MIFSGQFFTSYITSNIIIGTFLVVASVLAYFYDILITDRVIGFYKHVFLYMAVGILIWYLVIPPTEIYVDYFLEENEYFIQVFAGVLRYANIFMYSMFALGFYIEYRSEKKSMTPVYTSSE